MAIPNYYQATHVHVPNFFWFNVVLICAREQHVMWLNAIGKSTVSTWNWIKNNLNKWVVASGHEIVVTTTNAGGEDIHTCAHIQCLFILGTSRPNCLKMHRANSDDDDDDDDNGSSSSSETVATESNATIFCLVCIKSCQLVVHRLQLLHKLKMANKFGAAHW